MTQPGRASRLLAAAALPLLAGCQAWGPSAPAGAPASTSVRLTGQALTATGVAMGRPVALRVAGQPHVTDAAGGFAVDVQPGQVRVELAEPEHLPVALTLAVPAGAAFPPVALPLVAPAAEASDAVALGGVAVDPRGVPLAEGTVWLTTPYDGGQEAVRVALTPQGTFAWATRIPAAGLARQGVVFVTAAGRSRGGWEVESAGVAQLGLVPGQAGALVLPTRAAPQPRAPRWRWESPRLTVWLSDALTRADEARLVGPGGDHVGREAPQPGVVHFELPGVTRLVPADWQVDVLGASSPLGSEQPASPP
ncbi:MAG: hypothetical protein VKS61_11630 [Candidatus Sericytochromatia bacterium]|nr:hypothetical protein [Candidatus Sericytochromatia bacterium]